MGKHGNWKKEGYTIKHLDLPEDIRSGDNLTIACFNKNGEKVGQLDVYMNHSLSFIAASNVHVEEDYRRKGIASAMYEYAEKLIGKPMRPASEIADDPDNDSSDDANKFWEQSKRKFGE